MKYLERSSLDALLGALTNRGYTLVGPTVCDQVIVYDEIESVEDLPIGWRDEQGAGRYRLEKCPDDALFGYVVGPQSWKKLLFPSSQKLWSAKRTQTGFRVNDNDRETPQYAFIGVRSCELSAMAVQDRVFLDGKYVDPLYKARRDNAFIVAVNCGQAGGTCFCASMDTGPRAKEGFDIALTEVLRDSRHYFVAESGSERGAEVLESLPGRIAFADETAAADAILEQAASQMGREMDADGLKELLYESYDNPHWDEVAKRCMTCANCTMVCPTCFCTTVEDRTDLTGDNAERWRLWDSCFTMDFSYLHGGSIRQTPRSRYRQWMTHKLATWIDQFGTSGCVGCGRCITWCPVGIDITKEVQAIRESVKVSG